MRGNKYFTGVMCTLAGGSGLAEISTSDHGNFVLCLGLFVFGISVCLAELIMREER